MQAAWYSALGAASDVLEVGEVRTPEPGPGEVLVLVMASGVNPIDVKRRAGGRALAQTRRAGWFRMVLRGLQLACPPGGSGAARYLYRFAALV